MTPEEKDHALANQIQKELMRAEREGKFEDMRHELQGEIEVERD